MSMEITALAPWFGGKRTLAPRIIEQLGPHAAYWEPFCGSMAVLLAKPAASMETVNDLHGDLTNLAKIIKDRELGPILYRRLRRVLMSKDLHQDAADAVREEWDGALSIDRAESYFTGSWLGRNGTAGSKGYSFGYCTRYTKNGGHAATRFANAVSSIPAWRRRLRAVNILRQNAFELMPRIEDAKGVVIYVDPPYFVKGASYVHDFDSWDHYKLAKELRRFTKTRVVLSYYDHARLAELYPDWAQVKINVSKAMASQGKRDSTNDIRAVEVLLINGEPLERPAHT